MKGVVYRRRRRAKEVAGLICWQIWHVTFLSNNGIKCSHIIKTLHIDFILQPS